MFNSKGLIRLAGLSVGFYLLFIAAGLTLGLKELNATLYCNRKNVVFQSYFSRSDVHFLVVKKAGFDMQVSLKYQNSRQHTTVVFFFNSWYASYIPNSLLLALLLATSFGRKNNKVFTILGAMLILRVSLLIVLYVRLYVLRIEAQNILLDFRNTLTDKLVIFLHNSFAVHSWISFIIPIFVWVLVLFFSNRQQIIKLMQREDVP